LNLKRKKKKIRPEERKKIIEDSGQEGFKQIKNNRIVKEKDLDGLIENSYENSYNEYENKQNMYYDHELHHLNRGTMEFGNKNKRHFDKISGTGRGKEISKNGGGGSYTWGNPELLAKKEVYEEEGEEMYNDDEKYFEEALKLDDAKEENKKMVSPAKNSITYQEYKDIKKKMQEIIHLSDFKTEEPKKLIEEKVEPKKEAKKLRKLKTKEYSKVEDKINSLIGQKILKNLDYGNKENEGKFGNLYMKI